jgi:hypothetical protein
MKLAKEFKRIKHDHKLALRKRSALSVLGPSVIRVFVRKRTKKPLLNVLIKIPVGELGRIQSERGYKRWFGNLLGRVARVIKRTNEHNHRIYPGYKWGHAAKVLNLYLRDIVYNSRYFSDSVVDRVGFWLYVPLDSILLGRLRQLDCRTGLRAIKDIDTAKKFFSVQNKLAEAAAKVRVPRVWFDDNWADRQ